VHVRVFVQTWVQMVDKLAWTQSTHCSDTSLITAHTKADQLHCYRLVPPISCSAQLVANWISD